MDEFPPNSHKARSGRASEPPEPKRVERVTESTIVRRKRPLGKRLVETFFGGDARSVTTYLISEVLVPALKDTITDMVSQGLERMIYGETRTSRPRRSPYGPSHTGYVSYNRYASSTQERQRDEPRQGLSKRARAYHDLDEIVLKTRVEAEEVIDRLFDLIGRYEVATVGDLYELIGEPKSQVDERWGWRDLRGSNPSRTREGYVLNLPRPEQLD